MMIYCRRRKTILDRSPLGLGECMRSGSLMASALGCVKDQTQMVCEQFWECENLKKKIKRQITLDSNGPLNYCV